MGGLSAFASASLILAIFVSVMVVMAVAAWVAGHPEQIRAVFRAARAQPRLARLRARYHREIGFLVRRFHPAGAYGLSFTIGLAVLAMSAWLFGGILEDVLAHEEVALVDAPIVQYLAAHRVGWLTVAMRAVSELGRGWFIAVLVASVGLLLRWCSGTWRPRILLAAAAAGAALLDLVLKLAITRPRPPADWMAVTATGYAFPSGHTTQSAAYGTLAYLAARGRAWRVKVLIWTGAATLAFLIGASRVYLGVHWPTDVLGAWALAAAWLAILLTTTATIAKISTD